MTDTPDAARHARTLQQWLDDEARWRAVPRPDFGTASAADVAGLSGLDALRAMLEGKLPPPPIGRTLDFLLIDVEHGVATFQGRPSPALLNPLGTVHGGWYATLLDSAAGCAVHTVMPGGRGYTTLELKINIVRAVRPDAAVVRAIGYIIHVGRQVATAEAKLVGHDGTLYAHATTTCLVFEAKPRSPKA